MFTISEYEHIKKEFDIEMKAQSKKIRRLWGSIFIVSLLVSVGFIFLFPNQFKNSGTLWILPTYGGLAVLTGLIGYLISVKYVSEKPFFNVLFKRIYEKINLSLGLFLDYKAYEKKVGKEFNKNGGLFTGMCSVKVRRHVSGYTKNQTKFDIYDCIMTTSNGKSQQTHFDGTYYIVHRSLNTIVQARTKGSPRIKGKKLFRRKEVTNLKYYTESDQMIDSKDRQIMEFYEKVIIDPNIKSVYMGTNRDEVHLAVWYRKHPARKNKNVSINVLNAYKDTFEAELNVLEDINNIGYF